MARLMNSSATWDSLYMGTTMECSSVLLTVPPSGDSVVPARRWSTTIADPAASGFWFAAFYYTRSWLRGRRAGRRDGTSERFCRSRYDVQRTLQRELGPSRQ